MKAEYKVRSATEADVPRLLELMKLSLGEGTVPRDRAYWSWKHNSNPFGESPALVAESADQLVGLRVFMRWTWQIGDQPVRAVRAVDTATHPQWQGKGIFKKLTMSLVRAMEEDGTQLIFNTPNDQSRPGYLKMGWSSLGRTTPWIRPLRPGRMIRAQRTPHEVEPSTVLSGAALASEAFEVLAGLDLDAFLRGVRRSENHLHTRLTSEYLRWRYAAPGFQYFAGWSGDENCGALAIYRLKEQRGLTEVRLSETLVSNRKEARRRARGLLRHIFRMTGSDYASAMAARGTPEMSMLMRGGFLPAYRLGPTMTVRPLSWPTSAPDPLKRSSWQLSIGDLELF